jgi:hypothetical protein
MIEINSFDTAHEFSFLDISGIFVRMYFICMRWKETSKLFPVNDKIYMLVVNM